MTGKIAGGYMDVMAVRENETSPFVTAKIRSVESISMRNVVKPVIHELRFQTNLGRFRSFYL